MDRRKPAALAAALVMVGASAALTDGDPASASELKLVADTTFVQQTFGACSTDEVKVTGKAGENSASVDVPDACKGEDLVLYLGQDGTTYSANVASDGTATFDVALADGARTLLTANTWPLATNTDITESSTPSSDDFITCSLVDESTGAISNDCEVTFEITANNIWPITWTKGSPAGVNWWVNVTISTSNTTRAAWRLAVNVDSDALTTLMEQALVEKNARYTLDSLGFDIIRYFGLGSSINAQVFGDSGCETSPHIVTFGANANVDQYNYWPKVIDARHPISFQLFGSSSSTPYSSTSQIFSCPAS
jgi:hypothetical protein